MGRSTPTTVFDGAILPSQCRHIGHMHEAVWLKNVKKMTAMGTLTIFSLIWLLEFFSYMASLIWHFVYDV